MSDSDNDNGRLAPEAHEIDPAAEMEALRKREPLKVDLAHEILEEMGKTVGFDHNIKFEDGEFVLVASRQINDAQVLKGEVARAATLQAMLDRVIANDGYRLWDSTPANKNAGDAGREEIRAMLDERQRDEWEAVHGAHGVEELPSQLEARHERERANLELRLDLRPPQPGEFTSLDDFVRASQPMMREEWKAGRAEILGMVDAEDRDILKAWAEDWIDDADRAKAAAEIKELRGDVEQRIAEYQPWRGEFASLDAFMSATEHLAEHTEAQHIRDGEDATVIMPSALKSDLFSFGVALSEMVEGLACKVEAALWAGSQIGDSLGRTVDTMLGAVFGFFVAEPEMTAQQVHDTLQSAGNVETLHAREVAAAAAGEGEAYEFRAMMAKNQDEAQNVRMSMLLGTNATAEATLDADEQVAERRLTLSR